jgi:ferric-chelate reductase
VLILQCAAVVILLAYLALLVICSVYNVPLLENANRPGFIALAQLPPLFLVATKNSMLSFLLSGVGYESLTWLHKALGRGVFLAVAIHGACWIKDHLRWGNPILGQTKETSGIAAFSVLCMIVLSSLRPVRERFYQTFFVLQ